MRIAVLIDLAPTARYRTATIDAIDHAARGLALDIQSVALPTDTPSLVDEVAACDGIVIGPGSPYRDERAVWDVVRSARERGVPLVGT